MATIVAGNIVQEDLVFAYDTGYGVASNQEATRFYPGEPTTNATPSVDFLNMSNWTSSGWSGSLSVSTDYDNTIEMTSTNGWRTHNIDTGITSGGTVTVSYEYKIKSIQTSTIYMLNLNGTHLGTYTNGLGNINNADTTSGVWKTFTSSWTANSDSKLALGLRGSDGLGLTDTIYVRNLQVELNSHATPYTSSSRSDTASLIDLTKTTDIDVSNVSFDSTGQPSYDETDDHITGVLPMNGLGAAHTIEMIFSCSVNQGSIGGRKDPFSIGNSSVHQYSALDVNSGYMNWYFYGKDTSFTNSPLMVADQFYHIVLSYAGGYSNNTNKKVWINGVQQTLSSGVNETPLMPNNPSFSVGRDRGRNTAYWPGEIPVWRVYQKALTQDEAKQNYNAYKNRFNL